MRVLMFGWEFPPHISGGLGTACYGITKALAEQEIHILFVVPKLFGDEKKGNVSFIDANQTTINLSYPESQKILKHLNYIQVDSGIVPYTSPWNEEILTEKNIPLTKNENKKMLHFYFSGEYGKNLIKEVAQYALVAAEIVKKKSFDIIHAHDWLTYPAGIVAKEMSGKPLIVHVHATEYDRSGENPNKTVYEIEKKGMQAADTIIAVSEFTKKIIINKYGIPASKISVVHNGIIEAKNKFITKKTTPYRKKTVSFIGRITYQKGPDYFIETARMVLRKFPNTHFVMAGSGDMLLPMIHRIAELKLSSRFHFTGFLQAEEIEKLYALSDIYVMPSVSEPFGITPLEAMQSGIPVIISKQSGVSEVLTNVFKINFWDIHAMADTICNLLKHESLSDTLIHSGMQEIKNIKWEDSAIKIKKIYKSHLQVIH